MGETRNLFDRDAIAKIASLAKDQIALMCTFGTDGRMTTRPMATQGIDDDGTIWFFSHRDSRKNVHIAADPAIQLLYANHGKSEYLALDGRASLLRDQRKIDELWSPLAKTWFTEGKDDPDLTLVRFVPANGYYWDTKHGRMVALLAMAAGALTGRTMDDGVMGTLKP